MRQLHRLQHRLGVLLLVAHDELVERRVHAATSRSPFAHGGEVGERLVAAQVREVAALGARRLERVVDLGQLRSHQGEAAAAVREPQVLERGDVAEIPDERAHQRRVDALERAVVQVRDERERARARVAQRVEHVPCRARRRCRLARHPRQSVTSRAR